MTAAALFIGQGLGLNTGSASVLGASGLFGRAASGQKNESAYVNLANGNLLLQAQDEFIAARGVKAAFTRTYNAQGQFNDGVGAQWRSGLMKQVRLQSGRINEIGSRLLRVDGDGSSSEFICMADPDQAGAVLYRSTAGGGGYQNIVFVADANADGQGYWRWQGERQDALGLYEDYEADGNGNIMLAGDRNGPRLRYHWQGGQLQSLANASGDLTSFVYENGDLREIQTRAANGQQQIRVRYEYDALHRLTLVNTDLTPDNASDARVYQSRFDYDGSSNRIKRLAQSDGSQLNISYDAQNRVKTLVDALGHSTQFQYDGGQTTVIDANGVSIYSYDANGQLLGVDFQQRTASGSLNLVRSLRYAYDGQGNLQRFSEGLGADMRSTVYEYDAHGQRILERDHLGRTLRRSFDQHGQLLSTTQYTDLDPDGDGALMPQQAQTTRYFYHDGLLRYQVSAEGRVSEWRYNAAGERSSALLYGRETFNLPVQNSQDHNTVLQLLQSWSLARQGQISERIDYRYDVRGLLQDETRYEQLDSQGQGLVAGARRTSFVYDLSGNLRQKVDANQNLSNYVYDGLGRLLASTDPYGQVQSWNYDQLDADQGIVKISGRRAVDEFLEYDREGNLRAELRLRGTDGSGKPIYDSQLRYFYDSAQRLIAVENAFGQRNFVLYDSLGRKVGEIGRDGNLTEYQYDAHNQLQRSIAYSTRVSLSADALTGNPPPSLLLEQVRPQQSATAALENRSQWQFYDASGNLNLSVDALGAVSEYEYDGAQRLLRSTRYARQLTTEQLQTLQQSAQPLRPPLPARDAQHDRVTRQFYDADGKLIGSLDGEGYLRRHEYNAAGQLYHSVAYANATQTNLRAAASLAELTPATHADDQHSYRLYDARGLAAAEIDAENFLTSTTYDAAGNVGTRTRHAQRVSLHPGVTWATARYADLRISPDALDQSTVYTWDKNKRLQTEVAANGNITFYTYDAFGNLHNRQTGYNSEEERAVRYRYDAEGRIIAELAAEGAALLDQDDRKRAADEAPLLTEAQIQAIWNQYAVHYQLNDLGQRVSARDQRGKLSLYYYDSAGRLTHSINDDGEVQENVYTVYGEAASRRQYAKRLNSATLAALKQDHAGPRLETNGLISKQLLENLRSLQSKSTDAEQDQTSRWQYDQRGLLQKETDGLNLTSYRYYNAFAELTKETRQRRVDDSNPMTLLINEYERRGLLVARTPHGNAAMRTRQTYDAFGRVVDTIEAANFSNEVAKITHREYDHLGRVSVIRNPGGQNSGITVWDAFGRILNRTDAATGGVSRYVYDNSQRSLTITSAEGVVSTTRYTRHGDTLSISDGSTHKRYEYDPAGRLKSEQVRVSVDGSGNEIWQDVQSNTWDSSGILLSSRNGRGVETSFTYDAARRTLTRTLDPNGLNITTSYTWNSSGKVLTETDARGIVTATRYNAKGQVISIIVDPNRNETRNGTQDTYIGLHLETRFEYDSRGNQTRIIDPNGVITSVEESENGLCRTSILDAPASKKPEDAQGKQQHMTRVWRDAGGERIVLRLEGDDQTGIPTRYTYDANGRLEYEIDAMGGVTGYTYDAEGRQIRSTRYANPSNLLQAANVTNKTVFYSAGVKASIKADPQRDQSQYRVYDKDGRLAAQVAPDGGVTHYRYDSSGRVLEEIRYAKALAAGSWNGGNLSQLQTLLTDQRIANPMHDARTRYLYDARGRQIAILENMGSSSADGQLQWSVQSLVLDGNGNVTERRRFATPLLSSQPGESVSDSAINGFIAQMKAKSIADSSQDLIVRHVYDAANRLLGTASAAGLGDWRGHRRWAIERMQYDANGNLTRRQALHVWRQWPHAEDGDIIRNIAINEGQESHYRYDAANREVLRATLHSATNPNGPGLWAIEKRRYDKQGNLLEHLSLANLLEANNHSDLQGAEMATRIAALSLDPVNDRRIQYAYDSLRRQTWRMDAMGSLQQNLYDNFGNLTASIAYAIPAAADVSLSNTYQAQNSVEDRITRTVYDKMQRRIYQIDATGAVSRMEYDTQGQIHRSTRYAHQLSADALQKLGLQVQAQALQAVLKNDALQDRIARMVYDGAGRLLASVHALGYLSTNTYDALGHIRTRSRYAQALDAKIHSADVAGLPMLIWQAQSSQETQAQWAVQIRRDSYTYDARGKELSHLDPENNTDRTTWDALGNKTSFTNALNATWTYAYDALGRILRSSTPEVEIDTYGQVQDGVDGDWTGRTTLRRSIDTLFEYDALGNLRARVEAADIVGQMRRYTYDYDRMGRQTVSTLECDGRLAWNTANSTAMVNTPLRRNLESSAGSLVLSRVRYNTFGDAVMNTNAEDETSYKVYDRRGQLIYDISSSTYDAEEWLTPWTNHVIAYQRNSFGEVITQTQFNRGIPNLNVYYRAPLSADWVQQKIAERPQAHKALDRSWSMRYDALGRQLTRTENAVWMYDQSSRNGQYLLYAARREETRYNSFGEVAASLRYAVDAKEQIVTAIGGSHFASDKLGRVRWQYQLVDGNGAGYLTQNQYDAVGNLTHKSEYASLLSHTGEPQLPPSVLQTSNKDRHWRYDYDRNNRQVSQVQLGAGWINDAGQAAQGDIFTRYTYDAAGQQTGVLDAQGNLSSTGYDLAGRIISLAKLGRSGNLSNAPLTRLRLDAYGNTVLRIDYANGPLSSTDHRPREIDPARDRVTAMQYDGRGQMVTLIDAERHQKNFGYDRMGRLRMTWQSFHTQAIAGQGQEAASIPRTEATLLDYDRVGRNTGEYRMFLLQDLRAEPTYRAITNNSFGEQVRAWTVQSRESDAHIKRYDNSGHAWLDNSEDGVFKITLYNAQGQKSAEFTPDGSHHAASYATLVQSAQDVTQALSIGRQQLREYRYNLLGQMQEPGQVQAANAATLIKDKDGQWQISTNANTNADNTALSSPLLILGDVSEDAQQSIRAQYRLKGTQTWQNGSTLLQVKGNTLSLNSDLLAAGEYDYEISRSQTDEDAFDNIINSGSFIVRPKFGNPQARVRDIYWNISLLYSLLFGRAPDKPGAEFWKSALDRFDMQSVCEYFLSSEEGQQQIPNDSRQNEAILRKIFARTFGRDGLVANDKLPDSSYATDLNQWLGKLNSATTQPQRAKVLLDLLASGLLWNGSQDHAQRAASLLFTGRNDAVTHYLYDRQGEERALADRIYSQAASDLNAAMLLAAGAALKPSNVSYAYQVKAETPLANKPAEWQYTSAISRQGDNLQFDTDALGSGNYQYQVIETSGPENARQSVVIASGRLQVQSRGGGTNGDIAQDAKLQNGLWLASLYDVLGGRAIAAREMADWLPQVHANYFTLHGITAQLMQKPEFTSRYGTDPLQQIRNLLSQALGRSLNSDKAADQQELQTWINNYTQAASEGARAEVLFNILKTTLNPLRAQSATADQEQSTRRVRSRAQVVNYYLVQLKGQNDTELATLYALAQEPRDANLQRDAALQQAERYTRLGQASLLPALNLRLRVRDANNQFGPWQAANDKLRQLGGYNVLDSSGLLDGSYEYEAVAQDVQRYPQARFSGHLHVRNQLSTAPQKTISMLYDVLLGRAVDAAGLHSWSRALSAGQVNLRGVVSGILSSAEGSRLPQDNQALLQHIFSQGLNRSDNPQDPQYSSDFQFWLQRIGAAGNSDERAGVILDLLDHIQGSDSSYLPRYQARNRLLQRAETVIHYLQEMHGVEANVLAQLYAVAADNLTEALALSRQKGQTSLYNFQLSQVYQTLFGQAPTAAQLEADRQTLAGGTSLNSLIQQMLASSAAEQAGYPQDTNAADYLDKLIQTVYRNMLARQPSSDELSTWRKSFTSAGKDALGQYYFRAEFILQLNQQVLSYHGADVKRQQEQTAYRQRLGQTSNLVDYTWQAQVSGNLRIGGDSLEYDRWGNVTSRADAVNPNLRTYYEYDHNNRLLQESSSIALKDKGELQTRTLSHGYDILGQERKSVDALGNTIWKQYDDYGRLVQETQADGLITRYQVDAFGQQLAVQKKLSKDNDTYFSIYYQYDRLGHVTVRWHDAVDVYDYNETGDDKRSTYRFGAVTQRTNYRYDELGRQVAVGTSAWNDTMRNQEQNIIWDTRTVYGYKGLVLATYDAQNYYTRYDYDVLGHKVREIDALGTVQWSRMDGWGRVLEESDLGGHRIAYIYNAAGQLLEERLNPGTREESVRRKYSYDSKGNITAIYDTLRISQYRYDKAGRRISEQVYVRDNLQSPWQIVQQQKLRYNSAGWLLAVSSSVPDSVDNGVPVKTAPNNNFRLRYEYDLQGNRKRITNTWRDQNYVQSKQERTAELNYTYDVRNRQTGVTGNSKMYYECWWVGCIQ